MRLGYINVDAMLRSITARQFVEWEAYARMEPFNELREDYRAASIAQMVFNMAVAVKDRKDIDAFLLKFGEREPERHQTWQEQKALMMAVAMAYSAPAIES